MRKLGYLQYTLLSCFPSHLWLHIIPEKTTRGRENESKRPDVPAPFSDQDQSVWDMKNKETKRWVAGDRMNGKQWRDGGIGDSVLSQYAENDNQR